MRHCAKAALLLRKNKFKPEDAVFPIKFSRQVLVPGEKDTVDMTENTLA